MEFLCVLLSLLIVRYPCEPCASLLLFRKMGPLELPCSIKIYAVSIDVLMRHTDYIGFIIDRPIPRIFSLLDSAKSNLHPPEHALLLGNIRFNDIIFIYYY